MDEMKLSISSKRDTEEEKNLLFEEELRRRRGHRHEQIVLYNSSEMKKLVDVAVYFFFKHIKSYNAEIMYQSEFIDIILTLNDEVELRTSSYYDCTNFLKQSETKQLINSVDVIHLNDNKYAIKLFLKGTQLNSKISINKIKDLIHSGEDIEIVGQTGSGKTTVFLNILDELKKDSKYKIFNISKKDIGEGFKSLKNIDIHKYIKEDKIMYFVGDEIFTNVTANSLLDLKDYFKDHEKNIKFVITRFGRNTNFSNSFGDKYTIQNKDTRLLETTLFCIQSNGLRLVKEYNSLFRPKSIIDLSTFNNYSYITNEDTVYTVKKNFQKEYIENEIAELERQIEELKSEVSYLKAKL